MTLGEALTKAKALARKVRGQAAVAIVCRDGQIQVVPFNADCSCEKRELLGSGKPR